MRTAARRRMELSPSWDGLQSTVAQFSCKRSIAKELWDAKGNHAKGKSLEARETNIALDNIKA